MEANETNGGWARRWFMRVLAVLAVAAAAIALAVVISGSMDSSDDGDGDDQRPKQAQQQGGTEAETYVVQPGDTMVGIADELNIPIETLQQLNPKVDPQALGSGQVLRLR